MNSLSLQEDDQALEDQFYAARADQIIANKRRRLQEKADRLLAVEQENRRERAALADEQRRLDRRLNHYRAARATRRQNEFPTSD